MRSRGIVYGGSIHRRGRSERAQHEHEKDTSTERKNGYPKNICATYSICLGSTLGRVQCECLKFPLFHLFSTSFPLFSTFSCFTSRLILVPPIIVRVS